MIAKSVGNTYRIMSYSKMGIGATFADSAAEYIHIQTITERGMPRRL